MHFGVFVLGTGNHSAGWRYEGARRENMTLRDHFGLARVPAPRVVPGLPHHRNQSCDARPCVR
jgi:hypothetical protein